jgi:hypothetical protein
VEGERRGKRYLSIFPQRRPERGDEGDERGGQESGGDGPRGEIDRGREERWR